MASTMLASNALYLSYSEPLPQFDTADARVILARQGCTDTEIRAAQAYVSHHLWSGASEGKRLHAEDQEPSSSSGAIMSQKEPVRPTQANVQPRVLRGQQRIHTGCLRKDNNMKAMVYHKYGSPDVLQLEEVEKPAAKNNEALIKVHATSVSPADWHFRSGTPFLARLMAGGLLKPKTAILGLDVAGEVESVGASVRRLKEGDSVYGLVPPGMNGANAEYTSLPADQVLKKPANVTFEEAAAIPAAAGVAWLFLRAGGIKSGQTVLVNGASGGLGTFAVQLAKALETDVTGVCSTRNVDLVRSLGADQVVDYTKGDLTQSGHTYELIFDAVGRSSYSRCKSLPSPSGVYLTTDLTADIVLGMLSTSVIGSRKARFVSPRVTPEDLQFINGLVEDGKLRSVIDRTYPLSELAEAHRYAEKGHVRGRVIITGPD